MEVGLLLVTVDWGVVDVVAGVVRIIGCADCGVEEAIDILVFSWGKLGWSSERVHRWHTISLGDIFSAAFYTPHVILRAGTEEAEVNLRRDKTMQVFRE